MNAPLVSICVFTFNSATTVEQTLDSIYNQTYKNIELIISDDFSTDDTLPVCQKWIQTHNNRFHNCQLLTVNHNTGTTANTNRAYHASKGEWIKPIAADDLLKPYAIAKYLDYCNNTNAKACVTSLDYFGDATRITQKEISYSSFYNKYSQATKSERYNILLSECALPMPSLFISKSLLEEIGYADESYAFSEEWPLYMRIFEAGYDIPYLPIKLVEYRCENSCLSIGANYDNTIKGKSYQIARRKVFEDGYKFYLEYRRPRLLAQRKLYKVFSEDVSYKIIYLASQETRSSSDKFKLSCLRAISPRTYKNLYSYLRHASFKEFRRKAKAFFKL